MGPNNNRIINISQVVCKTYYRAWRTTTIITTSNKSEDLHLEQRLLGQESMCAVRLGWPS
jgi:hypothetical protein